MKTTYSSKFARIICITALTVIAACQVKSAHAVGISYLLTLTENSSTSLTLAYTGPGGSSAFSVLNTSPDHWTIQALSQTITFNDFTMDWEEPEEPTEVNEVYSGVTIGFNTLLVESDESLLTDGNGSIPIFPNNTVSPTPVGSDGGFLIFLQFNDLAAVPEAPNGVPENGSTLGLFGLAVIGLLGVRRQRFPRLA